MSELNVNPVTNSVLMDQISYYVRVKYTPDTPFTTATDKVKFAVGNIVNTGTELVSVDAESVQFHDNGTYCTYSFIIKGAGGFQTPVAGALSYTIALSINGIDTPLGAGANIQYTIKSYTDLKILEVLTPTFIGSPVCNVPIPLPLTDTPQLEDPHVTVMVKAPENDVSFAFISLPSFSFKNGQFPRCFVQSDITLPYDATSECFAYNGSVGGVFFDSPMYQIPLFNGRAYCSFFLTDQCIAPSQSSGIGFFYSGLGEGLSNQKMVLFGRPDEIQKKLQVPDIIDLVGNVLSYNHEQQGVHIQINKQPGIESATLIPRLKFSEGGNVGEKFLMPVVFPADAPCCQMLISYGEFADNGYYQLSYFALDHSNNITSSNGRVFSFSGSGSAYDPVYRDRTLPSPRVFWAKDGHTFNQEIGLDSGVPIINKVCSETGKYKIVLDIPTTETEITQGIEFSVCGAIKAHDHLGLVSNRLLTQEHLIVTAAQISAQQIDYIFDATVLIGFDSDQYGVPGQIWFTIEFPNERKYSLVWSCPIDTVAPGD